VRRGIAAVALLAGLAGALVTFIIGFAVNQSWECDGVCVERLDELLYIALAVGVLCSLAAAWIAWERLTRRPGDD
jgi:hypothetical protein